jgi:hypothetical protein
LERLETGSVTIQPTQDFSDISIHVNGPISLQSGRISALTRKPICDEVLGWPEIENIQFEPMGAPAHLREKEGIASKQCTQHLRLMWVF